MRDVILEPEWYALSAMPMVAYRIEENDIVGLIPAPGGYLLYDPETNGNQRVTAAIAATLKPTALAIYAPLPSKPLRPWDLFLFSLKGAERDLSQLVAGGVFMGLVGLISPLVVGHAIDEVIPAARLDILIQTGLILVIITATTTLMSLANNYATNRLQNKMSTRLQTAIWARLLYLPATFFRQYSSADLAMRANSIDQIRSLLANGVLAGFFTGLFACFNFILMFSIDAMLGVVALSSGVLIACAVVIFGGRSQRLRRTLYDMEGKLGSMMHENINGISKIRVAGAETTAFSRWAINFAQKRQREVDIIRVEADLDMVAGLLPILATTAICAIVGYQHLTVLTTGQFITFLSAMGGFHAGVAHLVNVALSMLEIIPLFERAKPILEAHPEVTEHHAMAAELSGQIELSRVTFRYGINSPDILSEVDLTIHPGEFVAIVGPSGSGKSTLLRLLLGFEKPSAGGVYYDGQDLASLDVGSVRRQIGVVLQNGELNAGDIFSNIVGSRLLSQEDAWEVARAAGLARDIEQMPMGMHTVLGHSLNISGGQRQRIFIARALAGKPRILLFDEATSALDSEAQAMVMDALHETKATRIAIAHRLSTVRHADRIVVLEKGRVVQSGTYEELNAADGPFRRLAERQTV